jgi:hypothetical protein
MVRWWHATVDGRAAPEPKKWVCTYSMGARLWLNSQWKMMMGERCVAVPHPVALACAGQRCGDTAPWPVAPAVATRAPSVPVLVMSMSVS